MSDKVLPLADLVSAWRRRSRDFRGQPFGPASSISNTWSAAATELEAALAERESAQPVAYVDPVMLRNIAKNTGATVYPAMTPGDVPLYAHPPERPPEIARETFEVWWSRTTMDFKTMQEPKKVARRAWNAALAERGKP